MLTETALPLRLVVTLDRAVGVPAMGIPTAIQDPKKTPFDTGVNCRAIVCV
jgi:hypothetical protein